MSEAVEQHAPPRWWRLGPALWASTAILLTAIYLVFNLPANWFGGGEPQSFPASSLVMAAGQARLDGSNLIVFRPDSKNTAIVVLGTPRLRTLDYGLVSFNVDGMPDDADVTLFWRNDLAPNKMFTRPVTVAGGRIQDAMVAGDSNWLGRISALGLIIHSPLANPVTIRRVELSPASASTVLLERWRDWTERESWTGISLFRVIGGRAGMNLPLTLLSAIACLVACMCYWAIRRLRKWVFSALTLAAIIATGWAVVDLRWQWNIVANAGTSLAKFGGNDLSGKRLASVDGDLERLAVEVRPLIPREARVFIVAIDPVAAGRLAYMLLPARVHYDISTNALPMPQQLKSGDLLLIHRKPGVRYSPERKEFLWDDRYRVNVEILLLRPGTVLAKVT